MEFTIEVAEIKFGYPPNSSMPSKILVIKHENDPENLIGISISPNHRFLYRMRHAKASHTVLREASNSLCQDSKAHMVEAAREIFAGMEDTGSLVKAPEALKDDFFEEFEKQVIAPLIRQR